MQAANQYAADIFLDAFFFALVNAVSSLWVADYTLRERGPVRPAEVQRLCGGEVRFPIPVGHLI